jgi:threonine dehydrogenase-like Zn-dependent dehydrogenase
MSSAAQGLKKRKKPFDRSQKWIKLMEVLAMFASMHANARGQGRVADMAVRVGVIGVGKIGQDHTRRIAHILSGATAVAVTDIDPARANAVAESIGPRADALGKVLINAQDVEGSLRGPLRELRG